MPVSPVVFVALVVAVLVAAYLIGAVPWALIVGRRFFGIDPRQHGSGNLGATNVFRVLGARAGIATAALDIGKGALAVAVSRLVISMGTFGMTTSDWVAVAAMMAAVLGHSYSPYIRFAGGKGVATAAGGIAVLMPLAWPILFLSFLAVVAASRMVSLGSVLIAIEFPVLVWLLYGDRWAFKWFAIITAALVVWRHRANIARIFKGTESKISLSRRGSALADKEEG